jgi:hypothetical protein
MSGHAYMRKIRICPVQERCDGATLYGEQEVCTRCAKKRAAASKPPKPLRGAKVSP